MSRNEGLGQVIRRNQVVIDDTSMIGDPFTAVKHANGLDWWLITPNRWTNSFNIILLDSSGPHFVGRQYIGIVPDPYREAGQGKFSPEGTKFAWYHPRGGVFLYDFDRENGTLGNYIQIDIPESTSITGGCEFSPSGKYLYVNHDTSLFQLDIKASDIQASLTHISDFDHFGDPLPTAFFFMERTPDRRIIMNALNGSQYLHVIQSPNNQGESCNFEQHSIKLPTINNFTIPHFPNYRLGALNDLSCDSLNVSNEKVISDPELSIYPNPTSGIIHISGTKVEAPYKLFDLRGIEIQSGISENGEISITQKGVFILRLLLNDKSIIRKVMVH